MKQSTKILILLILLSFTLSACAGGAATAASSWPGLTADSDTAYLAYNQHVYAVDLATGVEKWRFPKEADNKITFFATPLLTDDGQLLVGGYDNSLYSLDPKTGNEIWSFKDAKNRYISSPLAGNLHILAPNADRSLYALDFKGKLLWTYMTEGEQWAQPASDPNCECVFLTSMDHHIYAIDTQSGSEKWPAIDIGGASVGTPAYGPEGTLYIGTFNKEMLAINAESGQILWRQTTDGWVWGGPTLREGVLYFGDLSGSLYAMDALTGETLWKITPDGPIAQPPFLTEDTLYFTTEAGSVYALEYDGKILWEQNLTTISTQGANGEQKFLRGKLHASPVLAGDKILLAPSGVDEHLVALDINGSPQSVWVFIPAK